MVFHFEWGFPVKNLKHMNHLKTLTMVSMETKVVSRDSFLDKLSEKNLLEWILRRVTGFLLGGGGGAQCAPLGFWSPKKSLVWIGLKEKFGLFVDFEFLTEMGYWGTD